MSQRFVLAMLAVCLGTAAASASPSCMTLSEARRVWPTTYLSWRPASPSGFAGRGREHCWSSGEVIHRAAQLRHRQIEPIAIPLPADRPQAARDQDLRDGLMDYIQRSFPRDWNEADRWWMT